MTIGERIKKARMSKGLTQKALSELCRIAEPTIRKYESGRLNPKIETLQKLASALGVTAPFLIGYGLEDTSSNPFWGADLESKLKQVGHSTGFDDENAALWINYPDGALEVSEDDLKELHNSTNEYMCFKLGELKKKRRP